MGLGGCLLLVIFIGGTFGIFVDSLVRGLIYKIRDKYFVKTKKRREFKPGVLGKYGP